MLIRESEKIILEKAGKKVKVAVFASGTGTDFLALVKASMAQDLGWEVVILVTNNPEAGAIDKAKANNIPFVCINSKDFIKKGDFSKSLLNVLEQHETDLIALAGYLRKVPARIIERYQGKIINIHPALLPAFGGKGYYGKKVHQAVLDAGCKVSGVTVHYVSAKYDEGAIIAQQCVPVLDGDNAESLGRRILEIEHELYPKVVTRLVKENYR